MNYLPINTNGDRKAPKLIIYYDRKKGMKRLQLKQNVVMYFSGRGRHLLEIYRMLMNKNEHKRAQANSKVVMYT